MSVLFIVCVLTILFTNIDMTRKILPLKDSWTRMANVIAAVILFIWGARNGALMGGGGMSSF